MDELRLAQSTKMRLVLAVCSLAGVSLCLAPCDDAKFNIKIDLPDRKVYQCPNDPWPVPETVIQSLALWHPEQGALQYCMDREIEYNVSIPNSGPHRPSGARYGEYEFCPPQRWIKNLQHGAVAFLYHPCVNPVLKEDLLLLARACFYKYVITPHVSLTKDRPLAMVAWTATLEMQQINLTEAMAWRRGNEWRAPARQVKDVAVYDYLLMHQAKKGLRNINIKLCGGHREVESRQGTGKMKWGVGHGASNHLKLMKRRKREESIASSSTNSSPDVIAMLTVAEHLQGHSAATLLLKDRVYDGTNIDAKKLSQEHSQASRISSITRDYDGTVPSLGDSPRPIRERNYGNGTEVTLSALENAEHSKISHQEGTNGKGIVGVQESLKSAVQKSMFDVGSINNSENINSVNFRVSKALELRGTGPGGIGGTLMSTAPLLGSGENLKVKNTSQLPPLPEHVEQSSSSVKLASKEEILQEGGLLKANNSKQLVRLGNHSHILASSKHDESKKNSSNPESTKRDEQGALTEDSRISKLNITYPKNSSTVSPAASENGGVGEEGRGKEQCNCLKGVPHELDLHSHQPAMAQEGILDNSKHIQGGQEVPRAAADMFVRTPRTEEAAWAAAALTFLFVLLTLSVLYTRLWRKFRKSQSLYWAPDSDQEGQETVSAVIKRRLTVGQARRKKRQNYKKRPLVLYEDLSDSSD